MFRFRHNWFLYRPPSRLGNVDVTSSTRRKHKCLQCSSFIVWGKEMVMITVVVTKAVWWWGRQLRRWSLLQMALCACVLWKVTGTYFAPDNPERIMRWRFTWSEGKRNCVVKWDVPLKVYGNVSCIIPTVRRKPSAVSCKPIFDTNDILMIVSTNVFSWFSLCQDTC